MTERGCKVKYKAHLFICTNQPQNPEKCGSKQAEDLRRRLKERAQQEFGKDVRINAAGCLGACEDGIACVLYPQGQWFLNMKNDPKDEEKLLSAVRVAVMAAKE